MSVGVDSINPYGHSDSPLYGLWGHVMEAVVDTDYARKSFSPELAESWSAKGNQWTFKLRRNVNFHDGTPLTGSRAGNPALACCGWLEYGSSGWMMEDAAACAECP